MGLPENIDALLVKFDINQDALARVAEVSPSTVTRWRHGSQIRREPLAKICAHFGLTEDDLVSDAYGLAAKEHGRGKRVSARDDEDCSSVELRVFGRIAAGTPLEMEEGDFGFPCPSYLIRRHPKAFYLQVDGESMSRVLPNGSFVLVDPELRGRIIDNDVYALCVNGYDATVKRVRKLENGLELIPDSLDPTFHSMVYDQTVENTEFITIIGKVIWYTVPFDFEI